MERGLRTLLDGAVYEVIPMRSAFERASLLPAGASVSVTASPTKGMEATVALAEALAAAGYRAVPHLSARMIASRHELAGILERLAAAGVDRALVVGGDATEPGEFPDAPALLEAMDGMGHHFSSLGITGYPEGHPFISETALAEALKRKEPYATSISTQMCFDVDRIRRWVSGIRSEGIALPVVVGIPGAVEMAKLLTIGARIGVGASLRYLAKNRRALAGLLRPGHFTPDDLLRRLAPLAEDPVLDLTGLHVFTFNQVEETLAWFEAARQRA